MGQDTEELWQACTEAGEPITEKGITKPEAAAGALHMAAHVWIWRNGSNGIEVLTQKRAIDKPTWPGYLDISAAGHVDFGEHPLTSAVRESREEIGLEVRKNELKLLFVHRAYLIAESSGIKENEFQWVYGLPLAADTAFAFEDGEVESVAWLNLDQLQQVISGRNSNARIVPHGDVYFAALLQEIVRLCA